MTQQIVELPRLLTHQLMHLAQQTPDQEICGFIAADTGGKPLACYPIENCSHSPDNRFEMEPQQQIAAMRDMRERGQQLFAIYHSHPQGPAIPSTIDLHEANYPEALQLVISLGTKGILEMRVFRVIDQQFSELDLRLVE